MNTLAIDIGGTSAKVWGPFGQRLEKIPTGKNFTPEQLVEHCRPVIESQHCEVISVGYPGRIVNGRPAREPWNLGSGWVDFDYEGELGKPVRIANDACMQALGSYQGGTMLFVGLGTSVGGAFIIDNVVAPLEMGNIPFSRQATLEDVLSKRGLKRLGRGLWSRAALRVLPRLQNTFEAEYVVLGGGNAKLLVGNVPASVRLGNNRDAFLGGVRMWNMRSLVTAMWFTGDPRDVQSLSVHPPAASSG